MVGTPNLTLTVTPPGSGSTNYTQYLAWSGSSGQNTITQNFGRQGDTASFTLVDEFTSSPHFHIPVMSRVKLVDNTAGQTLFAGVINDPTLLVDSPNRFEWTLQCTDYTYYADNAIVHGTFIGWTVDAIIVALTNQANCGISAATIRNGGFVAPGPQLAAFVLNYTTLSDAWKKLAQLASQSTPYGWYVDENRALHFFDSTTAISSGATFTTSPTTAGAGSTTQGHFLYDNFQYEWDGTSIRNRVLVQGATQTIYYGTTKDKPTNTWLSNGVQDSWPLKYTPTGNPTLRINGKNTALTVVEAGASSNAEWQIVQNSIGAWNLVTDGPPSSGTKIQIWYDYLVPIVASANDHASQNTYTGPNNGVFVEYIYDSTLSTAPMALTRAQRERIEYAFAVERITFNTDESFFGWVRSGETCKIINSLIPDAQNSYALGINDTFLVTGNSVTFVNNGGYRQQSITAVRI